MLAIMSHARTKQSLCGPFRPVAMPFFDKEAFEIRNEIIVPWGSPKITQTKLSDEVTVGEPKVHLFEAGAEVEVQVEAVAEVEVEAKGRGQGRGLGVEVEVEVEVGRLRLRLGFRSKLGLRLRLRLRLRHT